MKTKEAIIELLQLTEMEYAKAVEQMGYNYANENCANCTGAVEYLTRTSAYWSWWKRHFDVRDEVFLAQYGSYNVDAAIDKDSYKFLKGIGVKPIISTKNWLRKLWLESHHPDNINARVPDKAWAQMIDAIRKEEDAQRPVQTTKRKEVTC